MRFSSLRNRGWLPRCQAQNFAAGCKSHVDFFGPRCRFEPQRHTGGCLSSSLTLTLVKCKPRLGKSGMFKAISVNQNKERLQIASQETSAKGKKKSSRTGRKVIKAADETWRKWHGNELRRAKENRTVLLAHQKGQPNSEPPKGAVVPT